MNTKQRGGLLRRKKQSAEDKAFTPELVQQRVKEYEAVKNKQKSAPKAEAKPAAKPEEKFDENKGASFSQAFKKASDSGDGLFKWNGKMYNTKKGTAKKQIGGKMSWPQKKLQNALDKQTAGSKYKGTGPNITGNQILDKAPIKPSKMPKASDKIKKAPAPRKLL